MRKYAFSVLSIAVFSLCFGLTSCNSGTTSSNSSGDSTYTLTVGMEANYAPFNWTEYTASDDNVAIKAQNGSYAAGYDVRVAQYIAEDNGWNLEIIAMEWDNLIPSLSSGTINAICAGMSDTDERRQTINFSDPYYASSLVLITRANDTRFPDGEAYFDFTQMDSSYKLVTQTGTFEDDLAADWAEEYGITHLSGTSDYPSAFLQVSNNIADAVICELPVALQTSLANTSLRVTYLDNTLIDDTYVQQTHICTGLNKNLDASIVSAINASIAEISEETRTTWMNECIQASLDY